MKRDLPTNLAFADTLVSVFAREKEVLRSISGPHFDEVLRVQMNWMKTPPVTGKVMRRRRWIGRPHGRTVGGVTNVHMDQAA